MTQLKVSRSVVYAVTQPPPEPPVRIARSVIYAVSQPPGASLLRVSRSAVYAVTQEAPVGDTSGDATQGETPPIFRKGTDMPYVEMGTSGELQVTFPEDDTYRLIALRPDGSFVETVHEMTAGLNTLPITGDWNQLALLRDADLDQAMIDYIKLTMVLRAGPSSAPDS